MGRATQMLFSGLFASFHGTFQPHLSGASGQSECIAGLKKQRQINNEFIVLIRLFICNL